MAHYTVIKSDQAIYKDGEAVSGCDMAGLPENLHALQWDGTAGQIEYSSVPIKVDFITSEEEIENLLSVSLTTLIERRTLRTVEIGEEKRLKEEKLLAKKMAADNE